MRRRLDSQTSENDPDSGNYGDYSGNYGDSGPLPVFVSPAELRYYVDDLQTHKQVLTIYNPYGYTLKYKVLCTSPRKYHVIESEGLIKSHCRMDVVVRHKEPLVPDDMTSTRPLDKFQIQLFEHGSTNIKGYKQVVSQVYPGRPKPPTPETPLQQLPVLPPPDPSRGPEGPAHRVDPLVLLLAVLCGTALLLPTWQIDSSTLPPYLHLTIHQKLVVAYVLGLVTMVILHF